MKTIRVDDEVYAWIQSRAIPLEDDANSVLRRELPIGNSNPLEAEENSVLRRELPIGNSNGKGRPTPKRIAHGERTPQEEFREPLLRVLYEAGGSLKRLEAIAAVGELMKDRLNKVDWQATKSGQVRWRNYVEFNRNTLADEGLLKRYSTRGVWELTANGMKEAKRLFG